MNKYIINHPYITGILIPIILYFTILLVIFYDLLENSNIGLLALVLFFLIFLINIYVIYIAKENRLPLIIFILIFIIFMFALAFMFIAGLHNIESLNELIRLQNNIDG